MKKMKNVKKLLLIGSLIFSINNVKAVEFVTGDNVSVIKDGQTSGYGFKYTKEGITYTNEYKYHTSYKGKNYTSYCKDPLLTGAGQKHVKNILGANSNKDDYMNAYDNGILKILENGKNQFNGSFNGLSGDELYLATSIAIRTYTTTFGYATGANLNNPYYRAKGSSLANLAIHWAKIYKDLVADAASYSGHDFSACNKNEDCIEKIIVSKVVGFYDKDILLNYGSEGSESYKIIYTAQRLYQMGLEAAREYYVNKDKEFSIESKALSTEIVKQENDYTQEYLYSQIDVKNLNAKDGYIKDVSIDCPDCNKNGVSILSIEYSIDNKNDWKTFSSPEDLSKYIEAGSLIDTRDVRTGIIKLRVLINKKTDLDSLENCDTTKYSIKFRYYNPGKEYYGALLSTTAMGGAVEAQEFFVIEKAEDSTNDGQVGTINGTIACGESVECQTEITTPICSDKEEEAVSSIKAPENIKKCILDKNDDANNSYTLSVDNGGLEKDGLSGDDKNDYCNVFCKEDYAEIKLNPIIEDVVCGGYFKLTSQIKGSKDCYTGGDTKDKSIDKEKYIQDVISAQEEMVSKYNDYLKWKESLNYIESESNKYDSKREEEDCYTNSEGEETCHTTCDSYGDCDGYNVEMDAGDGVLGYSLKNCNRETGVCTFAKDVALTNSYGEDGGKDGACNNGTCTPGKEGTLRSNIQERISEAEKALESAIKDYEQIVSDYNACTTGWTNDFKWQQKLKYEYNENQGDDKFEAPYYKLIPEDNTELLHLEATEDSLKEESEIVICTGEANDKYECLSESITLKGDADKGKLQTYNYNSSYGDAFEYKEYVKCDKNGCKIDPDANVSKALFVRKTVKKEQEYVTPTAFYQIAANGKITVMGTGYPEDKVQLEELKNSLPVSTKAVGGGIFKLMLEDFGEFYDEKDKLGRLINFGADNEKESIAYLKVNNNVENAFDGNYECYYESPCRPKDCPNCDFTCEGSDCKWSECPDCTISCVNCVFNLDELEINFRTVSTTNFGSVGRTFGYNWITEETFNKLDLKKQEQLELLKDKSTKTSDEIKDSNEMIYDPEGKTSDGSNALAFSIKLTPSAISKIKDYNKDHKGDGGYINDSLTCYDQGENKNIYCYSELIDDLVKDYDVTGVDNRLASDNERKNSEDQNNYWTTWPGYVYNESVIGGPSWK